VRQVITRVEDELHARLKEAAAARGISVNAFVVDTLAAAVGATTPREAVRRRAEAAGRRVLPPPPDDMPTWADVDAAGVEAGTAVSEALAEERAAL
jgi:plasmid stability protein